MLASWFEGFSEKVSGIWINCMLEVGWGRQERIYDKKSSLLKMIKIAHFIPKKKRKLNLAPASGSLKFYLNQFEEGKLLATVNA